MKASIIIPTYLRSALLSDTLECVSQQDTAAGDYEIIVVDNSPLPAQDVQAVVTERRLSFRDLHYLHFAPNGATPARHFGAKAARGEHLVFIDDDILCEPQWLTRILRPFDESCVGLVFGKTVLRYEVPPPPWASAFQVFLSGLDFGPQSRRLVPYETGYSCNMAVRARVFREVGGFNPDYFGDPCLLKYCGDGECGLARKAHARGDWVWYSAEAWLHHRVVARRLTPDYMRRRARISGVESVYCYYRYQKPGILRMAGCAIFSLAKAGVRYGLTLFRRGTSTPAMRGRVAARHHLNAFRQCLRLMTDPALRAFSLRKDYMDWFPQDIPGQSDRRPRREVPS